MSETTKELVAYCGLYCKDCIRYRNSIMERAQYVTSIIYSSYTDLICILNLINHLRLLLRRLSPIVAVLLVD